MRRTIRIIAILTLLGLGIAGWHYTEEPKPLVKIPVTRYHGYELNKLAIDKAKDFTVLISNEGFGGIGRGTGVLLDSTHVLTCAHMIEGQDSDMWIYPYPANVVVKGKPVIVNRDLDLAVVQLSSSVIVSSYATFQQNHYDGEPITIIGNTLGSMRWFISFGIISGEWEGYLLTDGVLYSGNSGGPWINEKGEVVALTDWTLLRKGQESGIHGGVSAKNILMFLNTWKSPTMKNIFDMILGINNKVGRK